MSISNYDVGRTAYTRVFLIPGRARPDTVPVYQSCLKAGSVSQGFGDIERVECPSDDEYGKFREVATIQGAVERASSSLMGRYAADLQSTLLTYAKQRCPVDVQVHFGKCSNPRDFKTFTKALIWENVSLTNYSTEDLGALSSDENAVINETSDLSIGEFYEVLQLSFQTRAPDVVVNEIVDAIVCDQVSCGDCDDPSAGCEKVFALQGALLGSPGTGPDIIYTNDKGLNWASDEIDTLTSSQAATAVACLGDNVVVTSNDAASLSYKPKATILAGTLSGWLEVTTGIVAGGEPNDIWSIGIGAFVVGDGGYVYYTTDASLGVTALDEGVATAQNLNAVHAISEELAVAVGDNDAIIYTTNRVTWQAATSTGGGANLQAVWMRSEQEWWVVDDAGDVYYTLDQGQTWTEKAIPGTLVTALYDIQFSSQSVGYIAGTANSVGAMWRTYDGGYSWVRLPEGVAALPGSSTKLGAIATCNLDVNFVVAGGLGAGNDGVLLVGED